MVHEVVGSRTAYDWVLRRAVLALNGARLVTWTVTWLKTKKPASN